MVEAHRGGQNPEHVGPIDRTARTVEAAFGTVLMSLNEEREERGEDSLTPQIERNRQNFPGTGYTWTGADGISRNILISIDEENPDTVAVEVNAWRDQESEDGTVERDWHNLEVGLLTVTGAGDQLNGLLRDAYDTVSELTEETLENKGILLPQAE